MVGIITQSSNLNSFSSICYCFIAVGIHSYSSFKAVTRYNEADSKAWPGGGGTPGEVSLVLGSTVVSLLMLPIFCLTCFIKVGNFANDGVKLGRDHALGYPMGNKSKDINTTQENMKRVWRHFCPLSQTVHLVAAFLLLLPETLLTAVEVKFGYRSTDVSWSSNLDFLYAPERALLSEIRSSVNVSHFTNATHVFLPTPRVPTEGWTDNVTVSIAFVNFCVALACFLVRFSSVFWYTNKPLTIVFALQLLAMVLNSVFSFSSFSVLYCVCYNKKTYPNLTLSMSCALGLILYLFGSTILLLSTMTVFEYGSHYFHEKFNIVERHHHPESYVKQTVVVNNGCQGYVPHSCAMAALIVFAVCKGPLLFDLVSIMRLTGDQLLLSGIICEVCYMVLWVALWFCLTIKQQWQFRILDYVSLRQPLYAMPDESVIKYNPGGHGDATQNDSLTRVKRLSGRDFPQKYVEPIAPGATNITDNQWIPDIGVDDPEFSNSTAEIVLDIDGNPVADSSFRRSRIRRTGGPRVTFDESVRNKSSADKQHTPTSSLTRQGTINPPRPDDTSHFNVRADVHNSTPSNSNSSNESNQDGVILRKKTSIMDNREYRNSIRSKCGEYYSSANNLSTGFDEAGVVQNPSEPLPTLMSSFRDKVRESSIAASTFKERERHMLEHFDYLDPLPPPIVEDLQNSDGEKRRGIAISDEDIGDESYQLQKNIGDKSCSIGNSGCNNGRYRQISSAEDAQRQAGAEVRYRFDDNINHDGFIYDSNISSSSLTRKKQHNTSLSSDDGHTSSLGNSTLESSDLSIPPAMEDLQLGGFRNVSAVGNVARKDDYLLQQHHHHPSLHQHNMVGDRFKSSLQPRPVQVIGKKNEIGRRDSANFSLTSSQDTSSNESDNGQGLCNQV